MFMENFICKKKKHNTKSKDFKEKYVYIYVML